jgi:lysylphosphatidylglycerol synthetase-like protein (DUF2156 family)
VSRHSRKRSGKTRPRPAQGQSGRATAEKKRREHSASQAKAAVSRRRRPAAEDRPPPLWAPFPLTELLTLAGIVLMVWGFLSGPAENGNAKIAAGLAISSLAGLELAIREHVTGFRSHTTLLSGAVAIFTIVVMGLGVGLKTLGVLLLFGLVAFVAAFVYLRELFKRRSGGLSFR